MRTYRKLLLAVLTVIALPLAAVAQERGVIAGQIIDAATNLPLPEVAVTVEGTVYRGRTDAQGQYRIPGVPPGRVQVRAGRVGYEGRNQAVTVVAGQTATANFSLSASAVGLDALVVTATGREERKRELGNTVATIRTADIAQAQVQDFSTLLSGRAAGVTVQSSGGDLGTGSRVAIRGLSSVSSESTPLIVIDGVRMDNTTEATAFFTGGQQTSRLNDINPEEIESIEILKGPAASALYGTAAANGVIQITTKRGTAGTNRLRAWAQTSTYRYDKDLIPDTYYAALLNEDGTINRRCSFLDIAYSRSCRRTSTGPLLDRPDTVFVYNPLLDDPNSTLDNGYVHEIGASLSGGSQNGQITYFMSAERNAGDGALPDNRIERNSFRANITADPGQNFRIGANTGFLDSYIQLPQNGSSNAGSIFFFGLTGTARPDLIESQGPLRSGFRFEDLSYWRNEEDTRRFTGSVNAQWTPIPWLSLNGVAGLDTYDRFERSFTPPANERGIGFQTGLREQYRLHSNELTLTFDATAKREFGEQLVSTTSGGVQYNSSGYDWTTGYSADIAPGTLRGTRPTSVSESSSERRIFGIYARQQFGLNDRLFVTGSIRGDQATELGANIGFVTYPSLSASWVLLEEPWLPEVNALSTLRLRAAYGVSGLRPGRLSAIPTFSTQPVSTGQGGGLVPGFILGNAGNPDLTVEKVTEFEFGGDIGFFDDRIGAEITHYNKETQDALVRRPLPPSLGGPISQLFNLGSVTNEGWEVGLRTEPIRRERFGLEFQINYATNKNRLVSLGDTTIPPIVIGSFQRNVEGYPLGSYFTPKYTYEDANSNGLIERGEVTLLPRDQQDIPELNTSYAGSPFPTRQLSISADARLFSAFRVSALLDHRGGHKLFNNTRIFRVQGQSEEGQVPGAATLEQQAAIIGYFDPGTYWGIIEDADFWKLREASLSWSAPAGLRRRLGGAENLQITLAGRNLATWTDYSGFDPEANNPGSVGSGDDPGRVAVSDFFVAPNPRIFTIRIDVTP